MIIRVVVLLLISLCCDAAEFDATVTRVLDGDSLRVIDRDGKKHELRLQGIDAPEWKQPWGDESRDALKQLLEGQPVLVVYSKRDRYGRLIAYVNVQPPDCERCGLTLDAGMHQLTTGSAWYFRRYEKELDEQRRGQYSFAETEARARKSGLWQSPAPVAPWDWRRQHPPRKH